MIMAVVVVMILLVTPQPIVLLIVLIEFAVVAIRVAVVLSRPLPVVAFLPIIRDSRGNKDRNPGSDAQNSRLSGSGKREP